MTAHTYSNNEINPLTFETLKAARDSIVCGRPEVDKELKELESTVRHIIQCNLTLQRAFGGRDV